MAHDGIFLILGLMLIWTCGRVARSFLERHKPVCDCRCCDEDEDDDSSEVIAAGGEEEDDS